MRSQGVALTRKGIRFCTRLVFFPDTFMVEDAVEAIGFGKFQWKLSVITGLAWASNCYQGQLHDHQLENLSDFQAVIYFCFFSTLLDGRCYGNDDFKYPSSSASL